MKLCDVLFAVGSAIVIVGTECIGIGVMITNGAALWEVILAMVIMLGVDLMAAAFLTLD
nr:MAG TPA: hypothetical protein [Caudoviricetes sp.]